MFYHRHGFEAYYIFLLPILVQLGFDSIERLRTPEAQQEHFPPIMKATRATLILCATGLRDQGRNFFLSELVFRILQDKMNPVDLKLLKDWARIKGEDKREKSMLEHVHSEYPVNVKSISSDPTDRRLNRLLQSMGDLKLPNDTAEPTPQDRTSRTWRSIVFSPQRQDWMTYIINIKYSTQYTIHNASYDFDYQRLDTLIRSCCICSLPHVGEPLELSSLIREIYSLVSSHYAGP